jgi:hypothetical protein
MLNAGERFSSGGSQGTGNGFALLCGVYTHTVVDFEEAPSPPGAMTWSRVRHRVREVPCAARHDTSRPSFSTRRSSSPSSETPPVASSRGAGMVLLEHRDRRAPAAVLLRGRAQRVRGQHVRRAHPEDFGVVEDSGRGADRASSGCVWLSISPMCWTTGARSVGVVTEAVRMACVRLEKKRKCASYCAPSEYSLISSKARCSTLLIAHWRFSV